jgi:hypothetical protein
MRLLALSVILLLILTPARADMTAAEGLTQYDKAPPDSRKILEFGLQSYAMGLAWGAQYYKTERHQPLMFCWPKNFLPTGDQVISIVREYLKKSTPKMGEQPMDFVVLYAMRDTFPCPE